MAKEISNTWTYFVDDRDGWRGSVITGESSLLCMKHSLAAVQDSFLCFWMCPLLFIDSLLASVPGGGTSFGQIESASSLLCCMLTGCICEKKKKTLPGTDTEIESCSHPLCTNHSGLKTCNSVSFSTRGRYKHQVNWKVVSTVFGPSPAHGRPSTALW